MSAVGIGERAGPPANLSEMSFRDGKSRDGRSIIGRDFIFSSLIRGCHGHRVVMDTWLSWIRGCLLHGYKVD